MTSVRVVETGLDEQGRSTVAADRLVDAQELPTGRLLYPMWRDDGVFGAAPGGGEPGLFPGPGGARFWLFTVRAGGPTDAGCGLHATKTLDLGYVVAGVVTMELEDGTQVALRAGDAYVQNGTVHGWRNHGAEDAMIALVVLGTG